ncbi:hypothetical protein HK104_004053 [Borealophlyctis nickersoniae]|nr:hypothetical protein HK104_004053 [Borealophlyctis nickersoniae]
MTGVPPRWQSLSKPVLPPPPRSPNRSPNRSPDRSTNDGLTEGKCLRRRITTWFGSPHSPSELSPPTRLAENAHVKTPAVEEIAAAADSAVVRLSQGLGSLSVNDGSRVIGCQLGKESECPLFVGLVLREEPINLPPDCQGDDVVLVHGHVSLQVTRKVAISRLAVVLLSGQGTTSRPVRDAESSCAVEIHSRPIARSVDVLVANSKDLDVGNHTIEFALPLPCKLPPTLRTGSVHRDVTHFLFANIRQIGEQSIVSGGEVAIHNCVAEARPRMRKVLEGRICQGDVHIRADIPDPAYMNEPEGFVTVALAATTASATITKAEIRWWEVISFRDSGKTYRRPISDPMDCSTTQPDIAQQFALPPFDSNAQADIEFASISIRHEIVVKLSLVSRGSHERTEETILPVTLHRLWKGEQTTAEEEGDSSSGMFHLGNGTTGNLEDSRVGMESHVLPQGTAPVVTQESDATSLVGRRPGSRRSLFSARRPVVPDTFDDRPRADKGDFALLQLQPRPDSPAAPAVAMALSNSPESVNPTPYVNLEPPRPKTHPPDRQLPARSSLKPELSRDFIRPARALSKPTVIPASTQIQSPTNDLADSPFAHDFIHPPPAYSEEFHLDHTNLPPLPQRPKPPQQQPALRSSPTALSLMGAKTLQELDQMLVRGEVSPAEYLRRRDQIQALAALDQALVEGLISGAEYVRKRDEIVLE